MDLRADDYDLIVCTHITNDKYEEDQPPAIGGKNEEGIKTQPCIESTDLDEKILSLLCDSQQIDDVLGECKEKNRSLKSKGT